jgi:hypothetical protein
VKGGGIPDAVAKALKGAIEGVNKVKP